MAPVFRKNCWSNNASFTGTSEYFRESCIHATIHNPTYIAAGSMGTGIIVANEMYDIVDYGGQTHVFWT